jgi:polygalacturonase
MIDIRDFGAIGDGTMLNTHAIQAAIDACSDAGHEGVLIAGGRYVTGTLYLKDHVVLHVAAGAELLGSTDIADYATDTHKNMYRNEPHMDRCLIFARGAEGIGIEGHGVIDGQGHRDTFPNPDDHLNHRPMLVRFVDCSRIRVRDITLRNPAAWTSAWLYCSDIVVDGVTIHSRANDNGDGLDFDGCRNVRVSNCALDTSDDSICLQASRPDRPCQDVVISNCLFTSKWAGIRIGLLSRGDFSNVTVTNCVFRDIDDAGLKIQLCEGGEMSHMLFANLVMRNVPRPVFMTFGQQHACVDAGEGLAPMKAMRSLMFSSLLIDASTCGKDSAVILVGQPGHPIEDVTFNDIHMVTGGSGTQRDAERRLPDLVPELLNGWWPEYDCFGATVPAHGIYADHVDGLSITNCSFDTVEEDSRPAVVCHDVTRLNLIPLKEPQ